MLCWGVVWCGWLVVLCTPGSHKLGSGSWPTRVRGDVVVGCGTAGGGEEVEVRGRRRGEGAEVVEDLQNGFHALQCVGLSLVALADDVIIRTSFSDVMCKKMEGLTG